MNNKDHLCLSNICINCVEWYLWLGLLKALQASSEYLLSTTRNLQRNVEAITTSMQVLPFSYWYVPFAHIMSRKCRKLQLRALVGRFGSQNAVMDRLMIQGPGRGPRGPKNVQGVNNFRQNLVWIWFLGILSHFFVHQLQNTIWATRGNTGSTISTRG